MENLVKVMANQIRTTGLPFPHISCLSLNIILTFSIQSRQNFGASNNHIERFMVLDILDNVTLQKHCFRLCVLNSGPSSFIVLTLNTFCCYS